MPQRHTTRKENLFILLCFAVYFVSYLTRINYAASVSTIITDMALDKATASLAVTGSFFTYGVGQILCGFLGDRIPPRQFITFGLLGTALCNLAVFFLNSIIMITIVWCFNGLFQAMLWPPLFRSMSEHLGDEAFQRACIVVSCAASIATLFVYLLLVPACVAWSSWRTAFLIPAFVGAAMAACWFVALGHYKSERPTIQPNAALPQEKKSSFGILLKAMLSASIPLVMLSMIMQGTMRDGVNTWMPTFISETYHWENTASIMSTAILPVFGILCILITGKLLIRLRNEQLTCLYFWGASLIATLLLFFGYSSSGVFAIAMMAIINGAAHGINHLISRIPKRFARFHRVSTVAGLINACTYIGSALSTYGFALLSDHFGWRITIISWAILSAIGLLATALSLKKYSRFIKAQEKT